jgi:hypothetical protein
MNHWQGQSVTFSTSGATEDRGYAVYKVVTYNPADPQPAETYFPTCANYVWAVLQEVGAKTTDDYGKVDPPNWPSDTPSPTDYQWGDKPRLTWTPGKSSIFSLSEVQPGDVLQFRNVTDDNEQHTTIVVANRGKGKLEVLEQNTNGRTFVTLDTLDFNDYKARPEAQGGVQAVWVYQPVFKPGYPDGIGAPGSAPQ